MNIDYVSRGAFLPAASRVANERGAEDPLVALASLLPLFELMAQEVYRPWCMFESERTAFTETLDVVSHLYTRADFDSLIGCRNDKEIGWMRAFRIPMEHWMKLFAFREDWIFDNAMATLVAAIITGINDPDGARVMRWRMSLDPACGRLPSCQVDPEWLFERIESADAYGKKATRWFNAVLKESKAEIQFRQAERFDPDNQLAYFAARRFAGEEYPAIARSVKPEGDPEHIRKGVVRYCDRTGLSLPGKPWQGISIN